MSHSADHEALTAWADALRNGLGRVRFGDLPDEEFERVLEAVPADDVDTLVVFAENASLAGLASMESAGPQVPRVRQAIASRRAELVGPGSSVVAFPTRGTTAQSAQPSPAAAKGLGLRVRAFFRRVMEAFAEEPTAFDDADGVTLPSEERAERCREKA